MSELVQELEKQLQEAKRKEAWENLQTEYKKESNKYKGQAYGSCALRYHNIDKYFHDYLQIGIQYFQDVYIAGPGEIIINTYEDYIKHFPAVSIHYKIEEINIFKNSTSLDIRFGIYDLKKPETGLKYKIDLETYKNLKNIMSSKIDGIFQESIKHTKFSEIGTYSNEDILRKQGCKLIELFDDELYLITSENHPFVYGRNLLITDLSINIMKDMLKEFQKQDALDKDEYFYGERIKRTGVYERKIKILEGLLGRI
jgi:hypothetical protein